MLLLILFSFAVYYTLARILTHPLKKLKQLDAAKIDDGVAPIEHKYKMDEIAVRLKDSLEEVRGAGVPETP
ncbi:hypothetical protein [Cohnella sp. 56]|uniref:hypothetical protein n=1 Tax=Cohnella sp. 56 TaxID=3113722 RepID=UPI0030EA4692